MNDSLRQVEDAATQLVQLTERMDRDHRTSDAAFIVGDARRLLARVQVYASKLYQGDVNES